MRDRLSLSSILLSLLLVVSGCDCDEESEDNPGSLTMFNKTSYYLHFLHPEQSALFVPPGESTSIEVVHSEIVTAIVAPGQEANGRVDVVAECCHYDNRDDCASVTVYPDVEPSEVGDAGIPSGDYDAGLPYQSPAVSKRRNQGDGLSADTSGPYCSDGEGSCPYIYTSDENGFLLQGEALVGALNKGAQRSDTVVLTARPTRDGFYRVRVATELEETNFIDHVHLEVVPHDANSRIVTDQKGRIYEVANWLPPVRAIDSTGEDVLQTLTKADRLYWSGKNRQGHLDGAIRDWVEVSFSLPEAANQVLLIIRGRNTRFMQDAYHAYIRQFGPGFPRLIRAVSSFGSYRSTLDRLMTSAGLSLDLAYWNGKRWIDSGHIKPLGPAADQWKAYPIEPSKSPVKRLRVRFAAMPEAWMLDAVHLGLKVNTDLKSERLNLKAVELSGPIALPKQPDLDLLLEADGRYLEIKTGHSADFLFGKVSLPTDKPRTAVLRLTGFYQENHDATVPCVYFKKLFNRCFTDNAFARFVLERLQWRDTVDRYARQSGMELE